MDETPQENKGLSLQEALKEWQEALCLLDWNLHARTLPEYEYRCTAKTGDKEGGSQAECTIDTWHSEAWITLGDHADDPEFSLVHELSHVLIDGLDRAANDLLNAIPDSPAKAALEDHLTRQVEIAVNKVTKALLSVRDKAQEVRPKVKTQIGPEHPNCRCMLPTYAPCPDNCPQELCSGKPADNGGYCELKDDKKEV